jgi:hypothetical protein
MLYNLCQVRPTYKSPNMQNNLCETLYTLCEALCNYRVKTV